ncbi:MAG TPA: site-specific integrase [Gemmataceae bacterium]|jgi:integrase|nr:site-specific integrase [Gemmataceae bacterium]
MRQREPWYRTSKGAWYVQVGRKQHRLVKGPEEATRKAAYEAFYKLMAARPEQLLSTQKVTVAFLCDLFLDHSQKNHEPQTYRLYRYYLQAFCDAYGRLLASELKPFHVTRWLDGRTGWKASRRHAALAPKRACAWADKQGILSPSPLRSLEVEPGNRRTRVLTKDEQDQILAAVKDQQFRDFLFAMLDTGCRPGEVARVTAAEVNLDLGVWVFEKHKTAKKTKKPRVVYLTPAMVEMTRARIEMFPDGPLFRGPRGNKPFTRNGIRCRFWRLREKLPHLKHFVAYSVRHNFCTSALMNGVGVAQVAELMGHSDTQMVSRVYGHLAEQVTHMREAARKATGS